MNFQQLAYVLALNEHKHFSRAAESCDVAQATLSAMLRKLEEELGLTLFDRTRAPLITTQDGELVVIMAREILSKRDELLGLSSNLSGQVQGQLRIGIIPTVAPLILPLFLSAFAAAFPHVSLQIQEVTTEEIVRLLASNDLDVGILATPIQGVDMHTYPLYREALQVYGVLDNEREFVHREELQGEQIWLLEEGHCFKDQVMTVCDLRATSRPHQQIEMRGSSFDTLVSLVDDFGGYTLLPELYAQRMPKRKRDKMRAFRAPQPVRQVSAMVYRPFAKKRLVDAFIHLIRQEVTKQRSDKAIHEEVIEINASFS
jgi:LysR family hydrogen peroxide-inducible transcriptional activator